MHIDAIYLGNVHVYFSLHCYRQTYFMDHNYVINYSDGATMYALL